MRTDDVENVLHGAADRLLDIRDQIGQAASSGLRLPRLRPGWLRTNLADACRTPRWPTSMQQLTRSASRSRSATSTNHRGQARGVLEENEGAIRPLARRARARAGR